VLGEIELEVARKEEKAGIGVEGVRERVET